MPSGRDDDNEPVELRDDGSSLPLSWLEEAYGSSPIASLVVDQKGSFLYANQALHEIFSIEKSGTISDFAELQIIDDAVDLADTIRRGLQGGTLPSTWRGWLEDGGARPLQVRFTVLPSRASQRILLCRFTSYEALDGELRVRLLSRLAAIHRSEIDLTEAGALLTETIHDYLRAPVVARWKLGSREHRTWACGDEELCQKMVRRSTESDVFEKGSAIHSLDDDQGTLTLKLDVGDGSSAWMAIATRTSSRTLDPSDPFWRSLATAAEGALQSAHRLEQHRQERLRLAAVIEQMPMAVAIFDPDGRILHLNLRGRAMVGRRSWTEIGPDDHPFVVRDLDGNILPRQKWPLLHALNTGEMYDEEEFVLDFGDKKRTISLSVLPIIDRDGEVASYLATARDITRSSQEARRKDEFLSVASHELRSPLTPLSGLLSMCQKQVEEGRDVDPELLQRAESQVQRLQRLIDGLLDMTRLETGKFPLDKRPTDMTRLVRRVMEPWLKGKQGGRMELTLPEGSIMARLDPDRIDQVITNIVDNSVKHGRPDGRIQVQLGTEDDEIVLVVRDEGDGMSQELIDRIFDRFFVVEDSDSSGTGLGLYISRQIVEDHGGSIDIESGSDEPTIVTVRLPVATQSGD